MGNKSLTSAKKAKNDVRVDTLTESEYLQQGGILPYVAGDLFAAA